MIGSGAASFAVTGSSLNAALRIIARLLIGALGDRDALQPDIEPRRIHHQEHVFDAAAFLADQRADRAAIVAIGQNASRARMNSQLFLELQAADVVARADSAIGADKKFGHDEQRQAFAARRRIRRAREHGMDDVGREVVLAIGDEDLLPGETVVIALFHRARAYRAEIRAGLRLGEIHRAAPLAGDQLREIKPALRVGAMRDQQLGGGLREDGTEREGEIGAGPHFEDRDAERERQPLAAAFLRQRQRVPAAGDESIVGLFESSRRSNRSVLQPAALAVADRVERRQDLAGEFRGFREDGIDGFG